MEAPLIQSYEGDTEPCQKPCDFCNGRKIFFAPETLAYFFGFAVTCLRHHGVPMTQTDQNLCAALYLLGFSLLRGDLGEIAEIKGEMTIKLVHPPGEELKFVVELPGDKQMTFSVDPHQIVNLAEPLKLTRN